MGWVSTLPTLAGRHHNLVGDHRIVTEKPYDLGYMRVLVYHWAGLKAGDTVLWTPQRSVETIARYKVLASRPHPVRQRQGVWQAMLAMQQPDITIAGRTFRALPRPMRPALDIRDLL